MRASRFLGEPIPEVAALSRLLRADARCIPIHSCAVLLDLGVVLASKRGGRYLTFLGATQTVIAGRIKASTSTSQVSERFASLYPFERARKPTKAAGDALWSQSVLSALAGYPAEPHTLWESSVPATPVRWCHRLVLRG